ncbi:hypothetical protein ACA910_004896 [Epithemia clementina (nom. ined.)]
MANRSNGKEESVLADKGLVKPQAPHKKKPSNEQVLNVAFFSFVGFLMVQAVFALIANSQSMLADSEAMSVDAITYLFNLCAERIKNRPYTEAELRMSKEDREHHRELQRLYLEMIPPAISVLALIAITCYAFSDACKTFYGSADDDEEGDVSVPIMFFFSGANLMLDIINVTCFARADMTFSLDILQQERSMIRESMKGHPHHEGTTQDVVDLASEDAMLLTPHQPVAATTPIKSIAYGAIDVTDAALSPPESLMVNLNMCSAWTHVCADTLRSSAVLLAAALATAMPSVDGLYADAAAAIVVSVIILVSLIPLMQGIVLTAIRIHELKSNRS